MRKLTEGDYDHVNKRIRQILREHGLNHECEDTSMGAALTVVEENNLPLSVLPSSTIYILYNTEAS